MLVSANPIALNWWLILFNKTRSWSKLVLFPSIFKKKEESSSFEVLLLDPLSDIKYLLNLLMVCDVQRLSILEI